jgi:hypothetical protein
VARPSLPLTKQPRSWGLSEKRYKGGSQFNCSRLSASALRKVIAKALRASFQRMVHRVLAVPLGSSDLLTK